MTEKSKTQMAYEAYGEFLNWKAPNGVQQILRWDDLHEDIQRAWFAAIMTTFMLEQGKTTIEGYVTEKDSNKGLLTVESTSGTYRLPEGLYYLGTSYASQPTVGDKVRAEVVPLHNGLFVTKVWEIE